MRSTMLALIGITAMAACGSSTNTQTDGMVVTKDLSQPDQPDMKKAKYKPNCGVIQGDPQTNLALGSTASQALYQKVVTCLQTTCGLPGLSDGGWGSKICSTQVDGGASAACDTCFNNASVNDRVHFIDASMKEIMCLPDTSAATCKACATDLDNCFDDPCTDDRDCAGFTIGGVAAVCDVDSTSSTFGTCIAMP